MPEKNTLEYALDLVSREARHLVADALYCQFHNTWADLVGNTEASDIDWFAWVLFSNDPVNTSPTRQAWELADDLTRWQYLHMARLCIANLSALTERIAHRYKAISEALNTAAKIERDELKKLNSR